MMKALIIKCGFVCYLIIIHLTALGNESKTYDEALIIYERQPKQALELIAPLIQSPNLQTKYKANYLAGYIYDKILHDYQKAIIHYNQANVAAIADSNASFERKCYKASGSLFYFLGLYKEALSYHKKAYDGSIEARINLSIVFQRFNQLDSALFYSYSAYEKAVVAKDQVSILKSLNEIRASYYYAGFYDKALEEGFNLLEYARDVNDEKYIGYALNNIGNTHHDAGNHEESNIYLKQALPYFESTSKMSIPYLNIGENYAMLSQHDSAIFYFKKAIMSGADKENKTYLSALKQCKESFEKLNIMDSAFFYSELLTDELLNDHLRLEELKKEEMKLFFDAFIAEQRYEQMASKRNKIIGWIIVASILAITLGYFIYKLRLRSKYIATFRS